MEYEAVIGLEIHMKLNTESKMFCACSNDIFGAGPNTRICPVCMGFPGTLPVVNKRAIELASLLGIALNGTIRHDTKFDRKNYFYPDIPKGYQISQYDQPLTENGKVHYLADGEGKEAGITRIHMEEDTGKSLHDHGKSYVDFNRSGTPLVEIVTEPDFRSEKEVSSFMKELQQTARYLGVSRADMEKGEMRCDVNISIRPSGQEEFGTKVEVKNMNSFSAIERAILFEIQRQKKLLEKGEQVIQETRGWVDDKKISQSQRSKEDAMDYRYFPEPDLPPLAIEPDFIEQLRKNIPELPSAKRQRYMKEHSLREDDARILAADLPLADFFEKVVELTSDPQKAASVILSVLLYHLKEDNKSITECDVTPEQVAELIGLVKKGDLSMSALKPVLEELYANGGEVEKVIEAKGLKQVSDTGEIEKVCQEVLNENPEIVEQYKGGKTAVIGFLVGQVMRKSGGKANPKMVNEILSKLLSD